MAQVGMSQEFQDYHTGTVPEGFEDILGEILRTKNGQLFDFIYHRD
jgi:hypothetical protein